ncbi:MAG: AMP-binding protein [Sneathiellaceae bacterium]
MTSGRNRRQVGVSEAMIESFGDLIFDWSHNLQVRHGDPIRLRDVAGYEANRVGAGLSDIEIAGRIGLSHQQVTVIRNMVERRRIRTDTYYRLNSLGGGRRYRAEEEAEAEAEAAAGPADDRLAESIRLDPARVRGFVEGGFWAGDTLAGWLDGHARARPDQVAVQDGERALTWRELATRVRDIAGGLRALGLRPGEVVAVQLPNGADYLLAYLAIAAVRAVMTTIYLPYRQREMQALLAHSRAAAFIGLADLKGFDPLDTVAGLQGGLPHLRHVIAAGGASPGRPSLDSLAEDGAAARAQGSRGIEPGQPVGADPLLLLYTSGTTAEPKAVPLTAHMMLGNARLGAAEHGFTAQERVLSLAPFGHLFGLYSFHLALYTGATNVLLPEFSPPGFVAAIAAQRPTALFAAPAHIAACLGGGFLEGQDLSCLRLAILSGAQVSPAIAEGLAARMTAGSVSQLWGMTEMQAGTYTRPGDPLAIAAATAGRPSPGGEIRTVDPDSGAVLPAGAEGELQFRGPGLFAGYHDNPAANEAAFSADGWFRTGDLAVIDTGGNLCLTGRSKDIINRGGVKFNPLDVERLLDAHPKVAQAAIAPVPDPVLGERACAYVVPAGEPPTLEELCAWLTAQGIARTRLPERLEILAEMPMTATRKIIKGRLKPAGT